jgi:alanine racemase
VRSLTALRLEGVYSHFAMSDELDKTFAHEQRRRFQTVLEVMAAAGLAPGVRHLCNSGGLLDLPAAHYDLVRVGILPLGVYPSKVCRRLPGLAPVMTVKARITALQELEPGDTVGYGRRYTATSRRRIGVLPLGYADGFPRVRNEGWVLVAGRRAPLVGGVAMDALAVDVTDVPGVKLYDEAVIVGRQGAEEITVEEVAALARSVAYDVLAGWRDRLPRIYAGATAAETGASS